MIGSIKVPNLIIPNSKILLVGESPGEDEEKAGEPFVGNSGQLLMNTISRFGISRNDISLANLCQYRPRGNKFELLRGTDQLKDGERELRDIIKAGAYNVIGALGNEPLTYLCGKYGISKYRGSIIPSTISERKVVPTFHPAYIVRNEGEYPTFAADVKRIVDESQRPTLDYTERNYYISPSFEWLELNKERYLSAPYLACDIESIKNTTTILCHSFAISPNESICLPHNDMYMPYIMELYASRAVKIFHFGIYDYEMLLVNGIDVKHYTEDTYILQHSLQPELPRGLDYLTSIHTREPYYKSEGRADIPDNTKAWSDKVDKNKLYIYNCKDSAVTYEIWEALMADVREDEYAQSTYDYEMSILPIALEIGRNGMLMDEEKKKYMEMALAQKWAKLQFALNMIAGKEVNVNSPKDMPALLYTQFKLPTRRKRGGGITTDEDAVVSLITYCKGYIDNLKTEKSRLQWQVKFEACKLILEIRGIRKLLSSYIKPAISSDGRVRSTYNVGGTETGRWSAFKYVDKTGINAQTLPREELVLPDTLDPDFNILKWINQIKEEEEYDLV